MSWLARLKSGNTTETDATKTTKRVSVVSVASIPADSPKNASGTQGRLLALAEADGIDPALVYGLPAADLHECEGLTDAQLGAYLSMLDTGATMRAGKVPDGYTQPAICQHCGPVWLWPDAGKVGANGWAHVLGCPWCHVTMPEGHRMPRPLVTSATCRRWTPDTVNPPGGRGQCACGSWWPNQRHMCDRYQPRATRDS